MANINYNRKCVICGKSYSFCNHGCSEDRGKPAWMTMFDSANCRAIYNTAVNATVGHALTKAEAKKRLKKLDLSAVSTENFNPIVKGWIEEITGEVFTSSESDYANPDEEAEG